MTVADLIAKLQTMPQEAVVVRGDADWGMVHITDVEVFDADRCTVYGTGEAEKIDYPVLLS